MSNFKIQLYRDFATFLTKRVNLESIEITEIRKIYKNN